MEGTIRPTVGGEIEDRKRNQAYAKSLENLQLDVERFSVGSTEQIQMQRNGDGGVEGYFLVKPVTVVR